MQPAGVRPVAVLPELYMPPSGFVVTPVLAHWERPAPVAPVDPAETAAVARVPVPSWPIRRTGSRCGTRRATSAPAFAVPGHAGLGVHGWPAGRAAAAGRLGASLGPPGSAISTPLGRSARLARQPTAATAAAAALADVRPRGELGRPGRARARRAGRGISGWRQGVRSGAAVLRRRARRGGHRGAARAAAGAGHRLDADPGRASVTVVVLLIALGETIGVLLVAGSGDRIRRQHVASGGQRARCGGAGGDRGGGRLAGRAAARLRGLPCAGRRGPRLRGAAGGGHRDAVRSPAAAGRAALGCSTSPGSPRCSPVQRDADHRGRSARPGAGQLARGAARLRRACSRSAAGPRPAPGSSRAPVS